MIPVNEYTFEHIDSYRTRVDSDFETVRTQYDPLGINTKELGRKFCFYSLIDGDTKNRSLFK